MQENEFIHLVFRKAQSVTLLTIIFISIAYHVTIQPNLKDEHKQRRVSFTYWIRKSLRKNDREKILFSNENYFELDNIYSRQNYRVYASCRQEY